MNGELVCNSQHMLATAVFYYTLSNMRSLGLAIWKTWKRHIRLWLQQTRLLSVLLARSLVMSGADRRDVPLLLGRRLKRQGINIPHGVSPAIQRFAGLSWVENKDQTQQLSAGKAERKSETRLDGETSSKQLRDQHRSTLAAKADLCFCPGSMDSFPARVVGVVKGRSGFRGGLLLLSLFF